MSKPKMIINLTELDRLKHSFGTFRRHLIKREVGLNAVMIDISDSSIKASVESVFSDCPKCKNYMLMVSMHGRLVVITACPTLLKTFRSIKKCAKG